MYKFGLLSDQYGISFLGSIVKHRHERDPMLNSVMNGDCSNSVPRRKIPEGALQLLLKLTVNFSILKILQKFHKTVFTDHPAYHLLTSMLLK